MLSTPGRIPCAWGGGWGPCTATTHLICSDVDPGGAPVLLNHLGQDALEQGQGVGDVGVEAVGEALNLPQVLVLLVLEDELHRRNPQGDFQNEAPTEMQGEEQDWDLLPPRAQRSAPGEPPPACGAQPAVGSARCPPRWEGRDRLTRGCQGEQRAGHEGTPSFLLWHPACMAPATPRLCGFYYGDTNTEQAGQDAALPVAQLSTLTTLILGMGPGGSHPASGTATPAGPTASSAHGPGSPVSKGGLEDLQVSLEGEHVLVLDEDAIGSQLGQEGEDLWVQVGSASRDNTVPRGWWGQLAG